METLATGQVHRAVTGYVENWLVVDVVVLEVEDVVEDEWLDVVVVREDVVVKLEDLVVLEEAFDIDGCAR